jgi:hypothetical protein
MSVSLVTIPAVSIGITSFLSMKKEMTTLIEQDLRQKSVDYQARVSENAKLVQSFLDMQNSLVLTQLAAISNDVKGMMTLTIQEYGADPPAAVRQRLYDQIAKIQVGKTGYVFVLDKSGDYIVSKSRQRDGEDI